MYRKTISCVSVIDTSSDRITGIRINQSNGALNVIGVYLPYKNCSISDPALFLDELYDMIQVLKETGPCVILGDFNAPIGPEGGPRGWGYTSN